MHFVSNADIFSKNIPFKIVTAQILSDNYENIRNNSFIY